MNDRILYQDPDTGTIVIVTPSGLLSTLETARKDVPAGVPFQIVSHADLPEYWSQEAWEVDFSTPDGVGIGDEAWFAEQAGE